jgi:hypothetical protein
LTFGEQINTFSTDFARHAKPFRDVHFVLTTALRHGTDATFLWGTTIVRVSGSVDTIVWGTNASEIIVAGAADTIVWGTSTVKTIVWGTSAADTADTIVWGTGTTDTIVWGTNATDTIIWGTTFGEGTVE